MTDDELVEFCESRISSYGHLPSDDAYRQLAQIVRDRTTLKKVWGEGNHDER